MTVQRMNEKNDYAACPVGENNNNKNNNNNGRSSSKSSNKNNNSNNNKYTAAGSDEEGDIGVSVEKRRMGAPPDGGWGWVVVLSSFSISFLVDGVCFSFGIFFDEFREEFQTSKATTSWIGSVLNGSYLIFGPLVSALVNRFGCRRVTLCGALLASTAFFISTFSTSVGLLIFTYGFLGGVGFGLMYLPAIVMVGYYFERKRALATGIACCGSGIGAFLWAPFTEYLLQEYGWRGSTWIISGLVFHGLLFALFYRPLPLIPSTQHRSPRGQRSDNDNKAAPVDADRVIPTVKEEEVKLMSAELDGAESKEPMADSEMRELGTAAGEGKRQISSELKNRIIKSLKATDMGLTPMYRARSLTLQSLVNDDPPPKNDIVRLAYSQDFSRPQTAHASRTRSRNSAARSHSHLECATPLQRKDIFYSGSVWHLKEFQEATSAEEYRHGVTTTTECEDESISISGGKNSFLGALKSIFDMDLLSSPTFLVYGMSCFLCMAGFFVPFIYLPTHVIAMGHDSRSAAFLISVIGITNTVGRVAVGFISDQPWADCLLINNVALMIGGVVTIFIPFYPHYYVLAIYAATFGTSIAVFVSLRSIIMVELMGLDKLTTAFGFVIMFQGLSSLLGAPIAGALSDETGSYDAAFYMAGITLTLSGAICVPLRRIARWEGRGQSAETIVSQQDSKLENGDVSSRSQGPAGSAVDGVKAMA